MNSITKKLIVLICALITIPVFAYQQPIPQGKTINKDAILKAISEYSSTITKDENAQSAYIDRAFLNYLLGNINDSIADYDKLISINPNNEEFYLNRGYLKHISNDRLGALTDYNTALKINPKYAFAYNNRGVVLSELGKNEESLIAYNNAITLNPNYADAYYNRGNLLTNTNKNNEALTDYNTAIKLNPHDSASYNNRGVVKRKLNYDIGALSDFSIAIKINPEDITALTNRGKLKKRFFDSEGASEDFENAITAANTIAIPIKQVEARTIAQSVQKENSSAQDNSQRTPQQAKQDNIHKISDTIIAENNTKTASIKANIVKVNPQSNKVSEIPVVTNEKQPKIDTKPVQNPKLAECYFIRALQKYILQKREDALADFNMAIQYNPGYAEAYYYRAAVKRDMKDNDFVNDYKKAVSINPSLKAVNEADVLTILKI